MRSSIEELRRLRLTLESAFQPDTASEGFTGTTPSTGHCAAVAAIVYELIGGELISATVQGQSHWLNRLKDGESLIDADITGDQFGMPPIQTSTPGELYRGIRVRQPSELTAETLERAALLARRAGLTEAANALAERLRSRFPGRTSMA